MPVKNVSTVPKKQNGVVLWITLMVMVVLLAATLVIARNSSIGLNVAGNLGFKKNATSAGDLGVEAALTWLRSQGGNTQLYKDKPTEGYFASWKVLSDNPDDFDWSNAAAARASGMSDYSIFYLVHRMCRFAGETTGTIYEQAAGTAPGTRTVLGTQECVYVPSKDGSKKLGSAAAAFPSKAEKPFYRITSRIIGPRNTVSYVQSMVY